MKVWRIENDKLKGPFTGANGVNNCPDRFRWTHPGHMPSIWSDTKHTEHMSTNGWVVCGWKTKGQMRRWFKSYMLKHLRENGYRLSEYDVDEGHYVFSEDQATFDRRYARLVKIHPLK